MLYVVVHKAWGGAVTCYVLSASATARQMQIQVADVVGRGGARNWSRLDANEPSLCVMVAGWSASSCALHRYPCRVLHPAQLA